MSSKIVPPLRRPVLLLSIAALAAASVVLPAVSGSETSPTITAINYGSGGYGESHYWSPPTATVSAGGVVTLSNPSEVKHGVEWVGGPEKPTCSGVPVGTTEAASGKRWSGTCAFAKPGTYIFYCTVHHSEMTGTITVSPAGGTTVEMPSMPSIGGSGLTPGSNGGSQPGGSGSSGGSQPSGPGLSGGSPFAGGSHALQLAAGQHSPSVHGSIDVSSDGAGGKLEVALLATGGSLAKAHRSSRVRVGRLLRSSVKAGVMSFVVPLTARGRSALHRHKRLLLTVRIVLTPVTGAPVTAMRGVVLHA